MGFVRGCFSLTFTSTPGQGLVRLVRLDISVGQGREPVLDALAARTAPPESRAGLRSGQGTAAAGVNAAPPPAYTQVPPSPSRQCAAVLVQGTLCPPTGLAAGRGAAQGRLPGC